MTMQILSLDKDGHTYVFRYLPGSEDETVDEIMRLAGDADTNLDWMDAAKLSFQVTQHVATNKNRRPIDRSERNA